MPNDLEKDLMPQPGEGVDPIELARRDLKSSLPKRFYKEVTVGQADDGFRVLLDGRPVRTPSRNFLAVPSEPLAQALAEEWAAQVEHIDPGCMPLTRILNSALDGVAREMAAVAADVVKYAGSDLLCYRAGEPESLVADQSRSWDPVLAWVRETHGSDFMLAEGVVFVEQPQPAMAAFAKAVEAFAGQGLGRPMRLAALHVATTLTGSAILSLALACGHLDAEAAWAAAHVDEDYQIRQWGEDSEAQERRARRWLDMQAAAQILQALR
jgi:chaperone required for assembly of F1-ATPase